MIIFQPPKPVVGAPNLSKGPRVFDAVVQPTDTVITSPGNTDAIVEDLKLMGDRYHVASVMNGKRKNGYGDTDPLKNQHSLLSCEIMRDAALLALGETPVFAPVSGFHHAGREQSHGYCTFNGLILAADAVRALRPNADVLIVDGDGHWGDGTESFCFKRPWIKNLSLSEDSTGGIAAVGLDLMIEALRVHSWDLVIYQAGADSHVADPYRVGYLTDEDWVERDTRLFQICRERQLPLVFNLAGGYNGDKTLELHASTVATYRKIYEV